MNDYELSSTGTKLAAEAKLCDKGSIEGAKKMASLWLIPKDAEKPMDKQKSKQEV